jgi:bis(5'-nucleosyl)-tetraphosphatase (symmetrical)
MATYAIGDIQGCYDDLQHLLENIKFDPEQDYLWFAGDLVNRGPKSLEVLRFIKALGDRAITVLGNHDLHLLAVWQHTHRHFKSNDTLQSILNAEDGTELLEWLRHQPLMHYDKALNYSMVHAGLPPQWSIKKALKRAQEVESVLRGEQFRDFLENMYGNTPKRWKKSLEGWDRLRFIVNCFTRLRYCSPKGKLQLIDKGHPGSQEEGYVPWFMVPDRKSRDDKIVFGHWSTLGLYLGHGVRSIDTGCLWGGALTALKIDNDSEAIISVGCKGERAPSGKRKA